MLNDCGDQVVVTAHVSCSLLVISVGLGISHF